MNSELDVERLLERVERESDRLTSRTRELIRFKTSAPNPPAESACQEYVARLLRAMGFDLDVWEPDVDDLRKSWSVMPEQTFKDRPIVVGRLAGAGGGRSIILNSHIDVVPAEPLDSWKYGAFEGIVENGRIYGRGAADMKGGLAAAILAIETVIQSNRRLKGDLIFQSVTDEEIGGQGTAACVRRGYSADGALIPEPTSLNVNIANRGLLWAKVKVVGKAAHAELAGGLPDWSHGGPVNAVEKALPVLASLNGLSNEWDTRSNKTHALLSTPKIVPTYIKGGNYAATYPDICEIILNAQYLPADRDSRGWGGSVKKEIEERIALGSRSDPWLRANPPSVEWMLDVPPIEIDKTHPIVKTLVSSAQVAGVQTKLQGMDTSDDAVPLMTLSSVPTITFGPGDIQIAHTVNEWVSMKDLVRAARVITAFLIEWCGIA